MSRDLLKKLWKLENVIIDSICGLHNVCVKHIGRPTLMRTHGIIRNLGIRRASVRRFNYGNLNSIILVFCSGWRSRTAVPRISILNFITNSSTKTCQDGWTNFEDRIKLGERGRARALRSDSESDNSRGNRYRRYYLVSWTTRAIEHDTIPSPRRSMRSNLLD